MHTHWTLLGTQFKTKAYPCCGFFFFLACWGYEYNRHGFWGKAISVPPPSINNNVICKISSSFIGELQQQYPFLAPHLRLIKIHGMIILLHRHFDLILS